MPMSSTLASSVAGFVYAILYTKPATEDSCTSVLQLTDRRQDRACCTCVASRDAVLRDSVSVENCLHKAGLVVAPSSGATYLDGEGIELTRDLHRVVRGMKSPAR